MGNDRTSRTKWLRNCRGQSIVELALITPLILVALMIPVDFGMGLFTAHYTQNAVREGARMGTTMRPFDQAAIEAATESEVTARLPDLLENQVVSAEVRGTPGDTCMVTVTATATGEYKYGFAYGLLRLILPGAVIPVSATITRATQMRYQLQSVQYSNPC